MIITGLIVAILCCGIMVISGIFLKWVELSYLGFSMSISGFDMRKADGDYIWMVLIGGILIVLFALLTLVSSVAKEEKKGLSQFGMSVIAGTLVTIGGGIWFLTDIADANAQINMFGDISGMGALLHASSGFYMSFAAAIIGFILAVVLVVLSRVRAPGDIIESSDGVAAPPAGTSRSVRDYYEKKASVSTQVFTPVQETATKVIGSTTISSLSPLPPTVDAAKAQECFEQACDFETVGKQEKAIEEYTKAIRLDARHAKAYFKRGLLLKTMSVKPAAVADFKRVIDISDSPELREQAKHHMAEMT